MLVAAAAGVLASADTASASVTDAQNIANVNSTLCLGVAPGNTERPAIPMNCVVAGPAAGYDQWQFNIFSNIGGDTIYQLENVAAGLCLAARGNSENVAVVTTCGTWADQHWRVLSFFTNGPAQIINVNSGLCLAMRSTQSYAVAATCDFNAHPPTYWADQHWNLTPGL